MSNNTENNNANTVTTNTVTTMNYTESIVALIKGENAEQAAAKIQRQMSLGFENQISLNKSERADLEDQVDQAKLAVYNALRNNGKEVRNRPTAMTTYLQAKQALEVAEEQLAHHDKVVTWLNEGKAIVDGQV